MLTIGMLRQCMYGTCRVLRFEFESARQLRVTKAFVLLSLLVGIAAFIILLIISRSVLVRSSLCPPGMNACLHSLRHVKRVCINFLLGVSIEVTSSNRPCGRHSSLWA